MIKKDLKCPKCGKTLLRGYSATIYSVVCKCGGNIYLKDNGKIDTVDSYNERRKVKHNAK